MLSTTSSKLAKSLQAKRHGTCTERPDIGQRLTPAGPDRRGGDHQYPVNRSRAIPGAALGEAWLFWRKSLVGVTFLDCLTFLVGQFLIDLIDVLGDGDHLLRDQVQHPEQTFSGRTVIM